MIFWTVLLLVATDVLLLLKTFAIVAAVFCSSFFKSLVWNFVCLAEISENFPSK